MKLVEDCCCGCCWSVALNYSINQRGSNIISRDVVGALLKTDAMVI